MKNYLTTTFVVLAALTAAAGGGFPKFSRARPITSGPKEHLFASYYAINAWSADNRYAMVLQTDVRRGLPTVNDPAVLGLVDLRDNNRFIPLADTRSWNFQEAAMAHWLATDPNRKIIYNDLVDGKFVSVIFDIETKAKKIIPYPVSAVSPNGREAVSINYVRMCLTRPAYGYDGKGQDARESVTWPEDDGLFLIDLETGEAKLIVSVASVRAMMPEAAEGKDLSYFCHTVFSRDGSKIFWMARSINPAILRDQKTTSFTCNRDGTDVRRCFPDGWSGSHFNWLDGDRLMVTSKYMGKVWSHVLFTVGKDDYTRVGMGLLDCDGHGVFSDDGKWMATDSYPDKLYERKLMVLRMSDQAVLPLGTYQVPEIYRFKQQNSKENYSRCDLHPRWRPDGKMLGFNSVHEGTRQVYVMDVEQ